MTTVSRAAPARHDQSRLFLSAAMKRQLPLIGGFLLLLAVAAASVWLLVDNNRFNVSVGRTLQIRSQAYRVLTLVQDAETGQRGYIITADRTYARPYLNAVTEIPQALVDLQRLAVHSDVQSAAIVRLRTSIAAKLKELAGTVAQMDAGKRDGAIDRVKQNVGKHLMDDVRVDIGRIEAEEERVQTMQAESAETNNILLACASLAGIAVVIGLAALTILSSRRSTEQLMKAQDALRNSNENLESIVAERVADLQAANDEIQRFAYIVSHDLRAPLVNVMGFTSELEAARAEIAGFLSGISGRMPELVTADVRAAVDTDLPEALGFIRTSTAKMDRLINAILKLSREGRRVLTPQKINVGDLVRSQGETLSQQLANADATLAVQDDLPEIVSDRLAIEQILGNIVENAVKYLARGRPGRITVTGKTQGAYVRYTITDNGRGIDAKDFERIFELFRRSGEQDKPGEGIGLAYVRNLARRLGGNVAVQSEFGHGSTFTVILPSVFSSKKDAAA